MTVNSWRISGRPLTWIVVPLLLLMSCRGDIRTESPGPIRLYTSVTEDTVQAVLDGFANSNAGIEVDVFRAPTAEVAARLAAEQREGGILADVLWLTDPLSMQQYEADGLLAEWTPEESEMVADVFHTETSWATRFLNMIIVHGDQLADPPATWHDLPLVTGGISIPDPGFAGSAFAALAYFALTPEYGIDYYRDLRAAGAVQVQSPSDVVNGVAEGQYVAGMTLDNTARTAIENGSPISLVWPEPGAVAIYSPIAVVAGSEHLAAAKALAGYALTREAQQAIADTGWQPVRIDIEWRQGGPQITLDWAQAFDRQQELLDEYRQIFGG